MNKKLTKIDTEKETEVIGLKEKLTKIEARLATSNTALLDLVGKSQDGIVILNNSKMVMYVNSAATNLFDRKATDLVGEPLDFTLDFESPSEINIPQPDGKISIAEVDVIQTEWKNEPCLLVSFRDITERKKAEEVLTYMSCHDYLTDLPDRIHFEKKISSAIHEAKENTGYMALLYLNLDDFKIVNDTFGHFVGDLLLKEVSDILESSVRQGDTVVRLGGDEFSIVLPSLRKADYTASVASKILTKLSKTFLLNEHEVYTNCSIGIAIYPAGGKNAISLIKNADTALHEAKENGKNQYRYFSSKLNKKDEKTLLLINGLRSFIQQGELTLCYQPIVDLKTGQCYGNEVLLRWQHPELGLLLPDIFLPHAEDAGMMVAIGHWVIEHALLEYEQLQLDQNLHLSINLSVYELEGTKVTEILLKCMTDLKIKPHNIILELTETSVMHHPEAAIRKLQELAGLGVQIAIDDYGTGYSSLSYLKRLPISILKIDKSFIDDIGKDPNNTIIVKSTIQLAHSLGLKVIAEGVETKVQFQFLKEHDCDFVQGYYFAKPMPANKLQACIEKINIEGASS